MGRVWDLSTNSALGLEMSPLLPQRALSIIGYAGAAVNHGRSARWTAAVRTHPQPFTRSAPPVRNLCWVEGVDLPCQNVAIEGLVFRILSKAKGLRRRSMDICLARMRMKSRRRGRRCRMRRSYRGNHVDRTLGRM